LAEAAAFRLLGLVSLFRLGFLIFDSECGLGGVLSATRKAALARRDVSSGLKSSSDFFSSMGASVMESEKLRISKIEAARRQLECAIELWFMEKDEVSVHTLAAAAYQLVHDLKNAKKLEVRLLYDSPMFKDAEDRKRWISLIKRPVNFFKHADNDAEETLEFSPRASMGFIVAAASGLRLLGERSSYHVNAFMFWLVINRPHWITPNFRKLYEDRIGVDTLQEFKVIPKRDFLEVFHRASAATHEIAAQLIPVGN
jgi:hypothetical protein